MTDKKLDEVWRALQWAKKDLLDAVDSLQDELTTCSVVSSSCRVRAIVVERRALALAAVAGKTGRS